MHLRRRRLAVFATALVTLGAGAACAGTTAAPAPDSPQADAAPTTPPAPPTPLTGTAAVAKKSPGKLVAGKAASTSVRNNLDPTAVRVPATRKVLPERMRGQAAVRALGEDLPTAASNSGVSPAKLKQVLTTDSSAWVSETGQLFYMEAAPQQATGAGTSAAAVPRAFPVTQTFALNSRPGSSRTVFLDFDGATVAGTAWNTATTDAITAATHPGWSLDGSPGSFTEAEHGYIQEVWRQVSETYAAFDVNVTTKDPGVAAYTRTDSADQTYGTHVVVTSSQIPRLEVCGGCLGVAWLGTFDYVDKTARLQPAWVFADASYDAMVIAQAASHEVGHTLGLDHDATNANPTYYAGTNAWGPIMGSARMRAVSHFSRGEYADANEKQDDLALISTGGLPVRPDDHGNDTAGARQLGALPTYATGGVISTRADKDVFAIELPCTTGLTVKADGIGAQSTLDLSLEVLNAGGTVVATSKPTSSYTWASGTPAPLSTNMNASVTLPDATGTYYLRVDGVGNGVASGTGWSDYASLGQYQLAATGCAVASNTPVPTPTTPAQPAPSVTPAPTAPAAPLTTTQPLVAPTKPSAPKIGKASSGARGGTVSATARWAAPSSTGGTAITRYRVRAQKRDSRNRVIRTYYSSYFASSARSLVWKLPRGRYSFAAAASNTVGSSKWSSSSAIVTAR